MGRIITSFNFPVKNLLVFWNMEQIPNQDQIDNSENGINLTYNVVDLDATSITGIAGKAISFTSQPEGSRNEGSRYFTDSWGVDVTSNFSLSVWIKPRSFDAYQHIIGAPFQNGLYIGGNDSNLTFNLFNGTVWGISAPSTDFNTWHHYVFIREGDTLKLYADNIYIGSTDITGESFNAASVFSVGGGEYSEYFFDGDIDALGVWNRVLTTNEISYLYNNAIGRQININKIFIKKQNLGGGKLISN